jgi:hypothetical protein
MSFHTSLVVTRPEFSDGVQASPLRVRFRLSLGEPGDPVVTLG